MRFGVSYYSLLDLDLKAIIQSIQYAEEAGIDYAVTMIPGPNDRNTDHHRLRRYAVGSDGSLARFAWLVHHAGVTVRSMVRPAAG